MKASVTVLALAAGLAIASQAAAAQAPAAPPPFPAAAPTAVTTATAAVAPMQIKQVTERVYMVTGGGGNSTVHVGLSEVILVDTKNAGTANYNDLIGRIRWATVLPVHTVIITHQHGDHSGNIGQFTAQRIPVIAHEALTAGLVRQPVAAGAAPPALPSISYPGSMYTVRNSYGGTEAIAYHFAPGHTAGDTVVYFPNDKVVSLGDELVATTPNIDSPNGGSAKGFRDSLAEVLKLDFDWAIPGHGDNPMTKAEVAAYKAKWDTFIQRGQAAVKSGVAKDKLMASIKTDDLGWNVNTPLWNQPARVDALYAELSN
jgi:glyoxylase-like metal-dependent hydrolase (beta-lactamase superfamily II)